MRKVILIGASMASLLLAVGCAGPATPGYTGAERNQLIARDMDYNGKQMIDDFDDVFLLRPAAV
jgi:hypothetical protein